MAEVFKAKAFGVEGFERLLAVKRILPNIAEDEEFIAMFIDEAKISVQLQHANIAQIFDLGKVDDSFFIALEYVNGKDLRSIFDRSRQKGELMPLSQASYIVMQVCEGLDYAHNKRDGQGRELHLVHRDISPQNVLIGYEGEIKLIDFGIAKAAGKASKTQAGILKGKFGYMSPEQVRGLPIDRRSDIFAVGIVLYELLTNERLFVGESDFSTLEKVRNVEILPPSSYNRKVPHELERIALKALAKEPEDRYQNAIDLHDDLQAFLYSVGEIYSRKDLAGWMKKSFAVEIEEDNAKLEIFRQISAPAAAAVSSTRRAAVGMGGGALPAPRGPAPGSNGGSLKGVAKEEMGWDEEELDTQIFDKDKNGDLAPIDPSDLFLEDDDRTVANEPPPDMLRAATAPEHLVTPLPQAPARSKTAALPPVGDPGGTAKAARPSAPPGRPPVPRGTLLGMPAARPPGRPPHPGAGVPPSGDQQRRSSGRMAVQGGGQGPPAGPRFPVPRGSSVAVPQQHSLDPAAAMSESRRSARQPSRKGLYAGLIVLALAVIGGTGGWYWWTVNKPGSVQLTTQPANATVLIDNVKVGEQSPTTVERPPGPYMLSVTHDGYVRNDQNIELRAGQQVKLSVTLEASPDTGFELTSEPSGGLVWLDGAPIKGADGQARTDFRAYRIAAGHHVLEIKGESRFRPWKQDVEIEPGAIKKIHALLLPVGGGDGAEPKAEPTRVAAVSPPLSAATHHTAAPRDEPAASTVTPAASTRVASSGRRRRAAHEPAADSSGASGDGDSESEPKERELTRTESAAGGDCSITLGSRPWSEVWIDGKNTNKHTPFADYKIDCGKHQVSFKRPDLQIDHPETISVRPGQKFKQSFTLQTEAD
jgi:serine/threonine protein kinase